MPFQSLTLLNWLRLNYTLRLIGKYMRTLIGMANALNNPRFLELEDHMDLVSQYLLHVDPVIQRQIIREHVMPQESVAFVDGLFDRVNQEVWHVANELYAFCQTLPAADRDYVMGEVAEELAKLNRFY